MATTMRRTPVTGVGHPRSETVLRPELEPIFTELAEQWESAGRLVPGRADGVDDPRPPPPLAQPLTPPQDFRGGIATVLPGLSDRHRGWAPVRQPHRSGPHGTAPTARRPRPLGKIRDLGRR